MKKEEVRREFAIPRTNSIRKTKSKIRSYNNFQESRLRRNTMMMFITIYGLNWMKVVEEDMTRNCSRRFRLDSRKCVFSNRVVDNWNSLSAHCIHSSTINTLKIHVSSEMKSGAVKFQVCYCDNRRYSLWRKHVLTHACRVRETLLASVNTVYHLGHLAMQRITRC